MSNQDLNTAVGFFRTIECFGDSLTAGTGGTPLATLLQRLLPGRMCLSRAIGGQTAEQISARQGGNSAPITVTLTGNAFNGVTAVTLTAISNQILSTPADNTTRYMSGSINGIQCALARTATGGPPSTSETYTVLPGYSTSAAIAAGSVFVPDEGFNARHSVQTLWLGRNNVPTLTGVPALVQGCISNLSLPRRFVVIGVLAALNETNGSGTKTAIDACNASLASIAASNGGVFVASTPPSTDEMAAVGYTPTGQDNTDIAAGVFPTGLRSDTGASALHLTTQGYQVFANRVVTALASKNW